MEKSLFEQVGGTYTQVGDYLLPNLTLTEEAQKSIGIWGQQHARYLKQYHKVIYYNYLTSGKLNAYLADIDEQAEEMFLRLVKDMADKQGIAENLKATDQMARVGKMNNIRNAAMEIVNYVLYYLASKYVNCQSCDQKLYLTHMCLYYSAEHFHSPYKFPCDLFNLIDY